MKSGLGNYSTSQDLTPEDWAAANQLADLLGVPCDELVRDFLDELERLTPEQRVEFERAVEKANEVLPDMHLSLDRIEQRLSRCRSAMYQLHQQMCETSRRISRIEATISMEDAND